MWVGPTDFSHSRKCSTDLPTSNLLGEFYQLKFLFPNNSNLCQVENQNKNKNKLPSTGRDPGSALQK